MLQNSSSPAPHVLCSTCPSTEKSNCVSYVTRVAFQPPKGGKFLLKQSKTSMKLSWLPATRNWFEGENFTQSTSCLPILSVILRLAKMVSSNTQEAARRLSKLTISSFRRSSKWCARNRPPTETRQNKQQKIISCWDANQRYCEGVQYVNWSSWINRPGQRNALPQLQNWKGGSIIQDIKSFRLFDEMIKNSSSYKIYNPTRSPTLSRSPNKTWCPPRLTPTPLARPSNWQLRHQAQRPAHNFHRPRPFRFPPLFPKFAP